MVRTTVVGIGGCGINIVSLFEMKVGTANTVAIDVDERALSMARVKHRIKTPSGRGTGGEYEEGYRLVKNVVAEAIKSLHGSDVIIVTSGIGGGMGSGGLIALAEELKDAMPEALKWYYIVLPSLNDAKSRIENAERALKELLPKADIVFVLSNEVLRKRPLSPSPRQLYEIGNRYIVESLKSILEIPEVKDAIQAVDFTHIEKVTRDGGLGVISFGTGRDVEAAFDQALRNYYCTARVEKGRSAVVFIEAPIAYLKAEDMDKVRDILMVKYGIEDYYIGAAYNWRVPGYRVTTLISRVKIREVEDLLKKVKE